MAPEKETPESSSTPSRTAKRKSSDFPPAPNSSTKRQKKEEAKTPGKDFKSKSVHKTHMVTIPAKGATPKITTPKDLILKSPSKDVKTPKENQRRSVKSPMVKTPAKDETLKIITPEDAILESPQDANLKTPKAPSTSSLFQVENSKS